MMRTLRRAHTSQSGAAMIIAIFAMLFLFGIATVVFSAAFGENSRSINNLSKQRATEAAYTGVDQGIQALIKPTGSNCGPSHNQTCSFLNPLDANSVSSTTGLSTAACAQGSTFISMSSSTESNAQQRQAYCYTVDCPIAPVNSFCPSSDRTIQALGRVENFNRKTSGGGTSYTYSSASARIKALP